MKRGGRAQFFARPEARRRAHRRVAMATLAVLWAVALISLILVGVQGTAFRHASAGREAVARTRAYWAARAGIEVQIAKMTAATLSPDTSSAFTLRDDLVIASKGEFDRWSYVIRHTDDNRAMVDGPLDAHTRLNVNLVQVEDLMLLDSMDEATASEIVSWRSPENESVSLLPGAYESLKYPYKPRRNAVRSLKELRLVSGMNPELLFGEDSNANNLLDPGEDDAGMSMPEDNADGTLEQGWSRYLTAASEPGTLGGYGLSGRKRIDLRSATPSEVAARLKVDQSQAQVMIDHANNGGSMSEFLTTTLSAMASTNTSSSTTATRLDGGNAVAELTRDQLKALFDEASTGEEEGYPRAGRLNINTVSREVLERLSALDPDLADTLISERDARSGGFVSVTDLLDVPGMSNDQLAELLDIMTVQSQVYVLTVRGRDAATGIEVEIVATVDRSTIPVLIRDLVVR